MENTSNEVHGDASSEASQAAVPAPESFRTGIAEVIDTLSGGKAPKKKALPRDAVATLGFSRLFGIDKAGRVSLDSIPFDVEELTFDVARSPENEGPITLSLGQGDLTLDSGVVVILGKADSGKSLLANTVKRLNPDLVDLYRFREPEADSLLSERELVAAVYRSLTVGTARVILVDSLRTIFYSSSGTTGKGGVNMGIFERLTALDVLARRVGKLLIFALNPMSSDADAIDFFLEATRGSVSHTFYATKPLAFRSSSRSGKNRDWVDHRYNPKAAPTLNGPLVTAAPNTFEVESNDEAGTSILDLYVTNR